MTRVTYKIARSYLCHRPQDRRRLPFRRCLRPTPRQRRRRSHPPDASKLASPYTLCHRPLCRPHFSTRPRPRLKEASARSTRHYPSDPIWPRSRTRSSRACPASQPPSRRQHHQRRHRQRTHLDSSRQHCSIPQSSDSIGDNEQWSPRSGWTAVLRSQDDSVGLPERQYGWR